MLLAGALACAKNAEVTKSADGGSDTATPNDAGASDKVAPNGCILHSTGYFAGKKADNVARTDFTNAVNWTNPNGALEDDGSFATITLGPDQESSSLRVSDFGFAVPDGADTYGIEVVLVRRSPDGGVGDSRIEVEIEGEEPRYKFVDGGWPESAIGTHPYGQALDTWGIDLYPRHVNAKSFAAKVSAKRETGATGTVLGIVESIKVAVWFCPH